MSFPGPLQAEAEIRGGGQQEAVAPEPGIEGPRLLCHLRAHAPEEYRETMIANVPLHREIMEGWREQQAAY